MKDLPEDVKLNKTEFKKYLDKERLIKEINAVIDEEIEIFALKLVTKNFVCKNSATSRKYEYIMPINILKIGKNSEKTSEEVVVMV